MTRRSATIPPLTQKRVNDLVHPDPTRRSLACYVPDHKVERLYVRVFPNGTKSYVVRYYLVGGAKKNFTLGGAETMTLADARERAREHLVGLDVRGVDPSAKAAEQRAIPTFAAFADRYIAEHAGTLRSAHEVERLINRHLRDRWSTRQLDQITHDDVLAVRTTLSKTPYEANRTRDVVQAMFNRALAWGVLPPTSRNPATQVPRFREQPRARVLSETEVRAVAEAIDSLGNPHTRALFHLLIEVPLRKNEAMRLRWDGLDLERRTLWVESNADNKRSSPQPLTDGICAVLAKLERFDNCPWVFPNRERNGPVRDIDARWREVQARCAVADVRLHDLRRTIATDYARMGASEYQIQRALGHSTTIAARHYVHLASADATRDLLERRDARLRGAGGGGGGGGKDAAG